MSTAFYPLPAPTAGRGGWLANATWDLSLVSWGWLPFYFAALFTPLSQPVPTAGWSETLDVAMAFVLAANFIHRHYVLVLVYGDAAAFRKHRVGYVVAPVVTFAIIATTQLIEVRWPLKSVMVLLALWNIWHVLQQRYGLTRIYGRIAAGGLETIRQRHLDRAFTWSALFAMIAILALFRAEPIFAHPLVLDALGWMQPQLESVPARAGLGLVLIAAAGIAIAWARSELRAAPETSRAPRLLHVMSTLALFGVFILNGPVLGFLCFGLAHALEYLGFVHITLERRVHAHPAGRLIRLLFASLWRTPLLVAPFLLAYLLARPYWASTTFGIWYLTTSTLHYLYDGWLWRRRPVRIAAT